MQQQQKSTSQGIGVNTTNIFLQYLHTLLRDQPNDLTKSTQAIREKALWLPFDKELALTKLDNRKMRMLYHHFQAAKVAFLLSLDPDEVTFDTLAQISQIENKFLIKMWRSDDGFERRMEATSIVKQDVTQKPLEAGEKKKGVFGLW